jgi:hypothetical protein
MPVQAGRPVLFACSEMIELMEELVGSYLTQVHLLHELESNDYDRFCQTTMQYIKVERIVCLSDLSDVKTAAIIAQHRKQ